MRKQINSPNQLLIFQLETISPFLFKIFQLFFVENFCNSGNLNGTLIIPLIYIESNRNSVTSFLFVEARLETQGSRPGPSPNGRHITHTRPHHEQTATTTLLPLPPTDTIHYTTLPPRLHPPRTTQTAHHTLHPDT